MLEEIIAAILKYSKADSLKITSTLGIMYFIMSTDKTRAMFMKLANGILKLLFSRIINITLKFTKKGSLFNDILTTMQKAILDNDKDVIEDIKSDVKDIKKGKGVVDLGSRPPMFVNIRRPIDVMVIDKKYLCRRVYYRNIARRRKLRRSLNK